jgi:hypothetical protein
MAKKKADGQPTKADAVREALKEGVDSPQDGAAYVKQKFRLDITPQQFSTYKSIEKKKANGGGTGVGNGRRGGGRPKADRPANGAASKGTGNAADLARQVKSLVDAYGAGQVKSMVEVFEG